MFWNKYDGLFRGWTFDVYCAHAPNQRHSLWIASGFMFFRDDYITPGLNGTLLTGLSLWTRWRLWRELKREQRRQAKAALKQSLMNLAYELTLRDEAQAPAKSTA